MTITVSKNATLTTNSDTTGGRTRILTTRIEGEVNAVIHINNTDMTTVSVNC